MSNIFDRIHISPPELVKSDAQLGAFTLDATFVPLKNPDGTYCFLNTSYSEKPNFHRFVGTPEDFLLKDIFYEMDYNGYSCAEPSGIWIMSAYKYTGSGTWKTDPMKCTGASILPDVGFRLDAHAKGVYCKALDRYLLTMQTNAEARLILFVSEDCEHFDQHIILDVAEEGKQMQPYSFFSATDGDCTDDMNVVGREFYIYYPRKGLFFGDPRAKYDYGYDDLYRVKVTVD